MKTVEEYLDDHLKQPGTFITPAEWRFIEDMRRAAAAGVGYGFMRQVIQWEWDALNNGLLAASRGCSPNSSSDH